jgi:hypothetical protein
MYVYVKIYKFWRDSFWDFVVDLDELNMSRGRGFRARVTV